jgi:hypothetical protein
VVDAKRFALILSLIFIGFLTQVNAPLIGAGYGLIVLATMLAIVYLDPLWSLIAVLVGQLIALPLIAASKSMFLTVAILSVVLRPIVASISSWTRKRRGWVTGGLVYSVLEPVIALTAGILYYGDDGIHVSFSIYDAVVVFLTLASIYSWNRDKALGLLGFIGVVLYIMGIGFFPTLASLFGVLTVIASMLLAYRGITGWIPFGGLIPLLLLGIAFGGSGLVANAKILGYPFTPKNYSGDRWTLPQPCAGRVHVFEGVHYPARLRIVHSCASVEGVVEGIPFTADDGDYCFDLRVVKANFTPTLSIGNYVLRHGYLHVEIIPKDRVLLFNLGGMICKGDLVNITGVHVVDTDHGQWAEIHPALNIRLVKRGNGPCISLVANITARG